jgi:hypothetical protein
VIVTGALIAESLAVGVVLEDVPLTVNRIRREQAPSSLSDAQRRAGAPATWTLIEFEAPADEAGTVAHALSTSLAPVGWYADFASRDERWVVYPGRVFRYARRDRTGRAAAAEHRRALGIPEAQLDWPD